MPTGYTADIKKGISFREYALGCARAFGALITMRDEPHSTPIPEKIEPSDYHSKKIIEIEKDLAKIRAMSADEAITASIEEFKKQTDSYNGRIKKYNELEEKYRLMLVEAKGYIPPSSDHEEYKRFMIKQIEDSIGFDCNTSYISKPKPIDGADWKKAKETRLVKDLEYHKKENNEEIRRAEDRTQWIQKMFQSLPSE